MGGMGCGRDWGWGRECKPHTSHTVPQEFIIISDSCGQQVLNSTHVKINRVIVTKGRCEWSWPPFHPRLGVPLETMLVCREGVDRQGAFPPWYGIVCWTQRVPVACQVLDMTPAVLCVVMMSGRAVWISWRDRHLESYEAAEPYRILMHRHWGRGHIGYL